MDGVFLQFFFRIFRPFERTYKCNLVSNKALISNIFVLPREELLISEPAK